MPYRSMFPRDILAEMDRLQRSMQQAFDVGPSIRGLSRGYPAINVGSTPSSVEIFVFAPGVDPSALEVQFEKGTLTIAGERKPAEVPDKATVHIDERFAGRFRRVVSLPDDIDPAAIEATFRDGVLRIRVGRSVEAQPRRIAIQ